MLFLIDYDRPRGKIINFITFQDRERKAAIERRLEIELELHRQGIDREVVLLEASSEQLLRQTHRRYFETVAELTRGWPLAERGLS